MTTSGDRGSGTSRLGSVGGLPVMTWPIFDALPVRAVVSTRDGGVSTGRYARLNLGLHVGDDPAHVRENRQRVAAALEVGLDDLVFCEQSHRPVVRVVTAADRGRGARSSSDALAGTDALVTADPAVVLVVMVADCVPLVLLDPVARVLACVHAGWRGTVLGVTPGAVRAMVGLGADPSRIVAGIGPAVHPDRYQVGSDVVGPAREAFGDRVEEVLRPVGGVPRPDPADSAGSAEGPGVRSGEETAVESGEETAVESGKKTAAGSGEELAQRWLFDLWAANRRQLLDAGVAADHIQVAGLGTGPGTPFFSHRFEGPCGRFAALARVE